MEEKVENIYPYAPIPIQEPSTGCEPLNFWAECLWDTKQGTEKLEQEREAPRSEASRQHLCEGQ